MLEISVNMPVFREDVIKIHVFGKGGDQSIRGLQALLVPVSLKNRERTADNRMLLDPAR